MKAMWDSAVLEDKKKIAPPPSPPWPKQLSDQGGVAHVFHGSDFFYTRTSSLNTAWNSTFTSLGYFCMHNNKIIHDVPFYIRFIIEGREQNADSVSPQIFLEWSKYLHTLISTWIPNFRIALHVFTSNHSYSLSVIFRVK